MTGGNQDGWNRVVPLSRVSNSRDLGGYRAANGKRVRRGLLYRSAALGAPNADGFGGSNSSIALPDGSSSRTCLPPLPTTMSPRKRAPAASQP
jgi:hypothetical protein